MDDAGLTVARENQRVIDGLWDYADPVVSEARLVDAAAGAQTEQQRAVLMTQVARALGLQSLFEEALAVLDKLAGIENTEVVVRVNLERGRVLNSSGSVVNARPLFEAAFERSFADGYEHLAIDALHMVAIIASPEHQVSLNEQAIGLARAASDPRARDWRASLLNNLGWTKFDAGNLDEALALFQEAVEERVRMGKARDIAAARWCVARVLRGLGRTEDALAAQIDLVQWMAAAELTDSFVEDEIGECLVALGRPEEAAFHFDLAANLLEAAGPGEDPDPDRLARLRALGDQSSTTADPDTA